MTQRFRVLLIMLLTATTLIAAEKNTSFQNIDDLIAKNQLTEALPLIDKGLLQNLKDLELLMRKSRIITLQGDQKQDEAGKVKSYEDAQEIANQMVKLDAQSAKGYLRRAIAKGKLILFKGILQSRSLILEVRDDATTVLGLASASTYEKALANYILGRAHLKLAAKPKALRLPLGLAWASKSKGGEFLKTAYELSPHSISFNFDYALWLKDNDNLSLAKSILTKMDTLDIYDPADVDHKKAAKDQLSKL